MKTIRRLVVSLDGTWNNRDDSTNVLFSHSLCYECENEIQGGIRVTQRRFYQEGVGTGPLDRITGGGFGFGLDCHVREAYDWLVQNYQDGAGTEENPPDEIYVFGFSRGAYTARSLVGFIGMCGLLRRGAPLTVTQLWENYCILGLALEERNGGLTSKIFGKSIPRFRRITDLVWDPWYVRASTNVPPGQVPGQRQNVVFSPTEELLVRWSRRVKITYLGVYDTVGAVGWDALAIPGLRSRLAVQHNMRPSTIIQKCRHALAIDEQRSSFNHTPFAAYIGEKTSGDELQRIHDTVPNTSSTHKLKMQSDKWREVEKKWQEKIEQCWFVGAHSNIGGGYADNLLAQRPLEWMLEGAQAAGLICEKLPPIPKVTRLQAAPRDSFAEFAAPLWAMLLRAKRNYRVIDPKPELRANHDERENKGEVRAGFSLVNINETVDESVLDYWKDSSVAPPNLIEWARRQKDAYPTRKDDLEALTQKKEQNTWPGKGYLPQTVLVLWATLAAGGVVVTDKLFCVWPYSAPAMWLLCLLGAVFPLVDFLENHFNTVIAKDGSTPWHRAFLDSIYWTRSLGVVLFAFGLLGAVLLIWNAGWHTPGFADALNTLWHIVVKCGAVALCAAAGVVVANALNGSLTVPKDKQLFGISLGPLIVVALVALTILLAHSFGHVASAALNFTQAAKVVAPVTENVRTAGLLLLLQLILAYFSRTLIWVEEPMNNANLGSITLLQKERTPEGVQRCLNRWCKMLGDHGGDKTMTCAMVGPVRQALWRDAFGFIPVYSLLLLFGFWFGVKQMRWENWWSPLDYLWWVIPFAIAIADYFENVCHLHYLKIHAARIKPNKVETSESPTVTPSVNAEHSAPNGFLTHFAFFVSQTKNYAFILGLLAVILTILWISWKIALSPQLYGWRGLIGLCITALTIVVVAILLIWARLYKFLEKQKGG
jgi:uncharacterized protein (DUF2235 family)